MQPIRHRQKTLTPADNLVVDGIPPIPVELPEQVGRYTESRAAGFQDWHPTRPEMLITTRFGDTNQIHRVTPARRCAHPAHLFPGPRRRRIVRADQGRLFRFCEGRGRKRIQPELPLRFLRWADHHAHRRQVAKFCADLEYEGRSHRLYFHATQRRRHRYLC